VPRTTDPPGDDSRGKGGFPTPWGYARQVMDERYQRQRQELRGYLEQATPIALLADRLYQEWREAVEEPIQDGQKAANRSAAYWWQVTERLVKRAEAAGCPVMALTVDLPAGRNTETFERLKRLDTRPCAACHDPGPEGIFKRKPMFDGIDTKGLRIFHDTADWAFVERLRGITRMKLVLKGIGTREDAALALQHGVDGLIVSNHGGRAEESGRGTLECLPEVVEAVAGRIPVLLDGGIRGGTDIFKALALGASAVCIGRPYVWGVGAFGQAGVERVLEILQAELVLAMKQCGIRSLREFTPGAVHVRA